MFISNIISMGTDDRRTRLRRIVTNRRQKSNLYTIKSISLFRCISERLLTQMSSQNSSGGTVRLNFKRLMDTRLVSQVLHNSSSRQLERIVNNTIRNSLLLFRGLRRNKLNFQQDTISFIDRCREYGSQPFTRLRLIILLVMRDRARCIQERRV